MTDDEFATWQRRLFIVQPSIRSWLKQHSPNMLDTLAVWRDVLRDYKLDECLLVLDEWTNGVYPAPSNFERDHFAVHVKAAVDLKRDRRRKAEQQTSREEHQRHRLDEYQRIGGVRKARVGLLFKDPQMLKAFNLLKKENERLKQGLIGLNEYEKSKKEILQIIQ